MGLTCSNFRNAGAAQIENYMHAVT